MRKFTYLAMLTAIIFASSCDLLDVEIDDRLTMDMIFEDRLTVESYLYNIYSHSPQEHNHDQTPWVPASDEADFIYRRGYQDMNSGNWDPDNAPYQKWNEYYQGINKASYFIQNIEVTDDLTQNQVTQYIAEARFLRAYFYFLLIRQYGPVIILGEDPYPIDGDLNRARATFEESVEWVADEFEKAAEELPLTWQSQWYGKPTRGAALAYRSRLLLYAASLLYNGNPAYANVSNLDGTLLFPASYSQEKWRLAAD